MTMVYGKEELLPRVVSVETCPDYKILLTFQNGEKKTYDVRPLFELPAYRKIRNVFDAAKVEYGTVVWPGDIDISPDTLYLKGTPVE